ncbi:hypothetical protein B0H17DRAFT_1213505 [Mycena rosella]|uniref:Uncharacterized protein n=1 Tax=Mycena rosella TaxID=1033263 RepID=A0AAD7G1U3_MYCRO|nr:hypothetical protein B0H17DRAFT_1213505 [Mycena rosella]
MSLHDGTYKDWAYFSTRVGHQACPPTRMSADAESEENLQRLEEQHERVATSCLFVRASLELCLKLTQSLFKLYLDFDPLQPIADYIFSHSFAWGALFGDNDVKEMIGDLRPGEDLRKLLKCLRPRVRVDKKFDMPREFSRAGSGQSFPTASGTHRPDISTSPAVVFEHAPTHSEKTLALSPKAPALSEQKVKPDVP